ncbi:ABC transporter substrate-binding protein [Sporichthya sp.]|uniref:ABC transporter substrate-binding protein n=1 Tax=Sporichthya sp. TaxID=65475 RepID=UPI0017E562AC|nr:ABC transporter substrate-binding protein [Sporichthya sp.]MBA3742644.1 ABC transporter substrate-binding protein [Sporichthya sp.]
MRQSLKVPALVIAGALVLAACGGGDDEADSGGADASGVKTGPGISDDSITLGVMTDLTGPFKDFSTTLQAGHKMWVDEVNAKGGVCARQIQLESRDHGYKAETATIQFPDLEPNVAGFMELLGSPMIAALKTDINDKQVTTMAVSWSSELLDQPYVIIVGTTYDLEIINGLDYLLEKGDLKKGDTIGHIYIDGEYGANGLAGSKYFAEKNGLKVSEAKVTSTDTDMKSLVTKFKSDKVTAIALTTSPAQTASAATNNVGLGLNVPMIGNSPVFAPALLDTPAAPALSKLYVVASAVPFDSSVPKAKEVATKFIAENPDVKPSFTVQYGYAQGLIWGQILQKACDAKDLSRAGINAALKSSNNITTDKLVSDLDFSKPGSPSSRTVYIGQVDKDSPGGLKQVQALKEFPDAKTYKAPHES